MKTKIVAVIQARLGSARLPYKMMLSLHGHPIIEWVVRRVQKSKLLNDVIVAIPDNKQNIVLRRCLELLDVEVYCGSEHDVLNRIYNAAKTKNATHVVRICADNPLVSGNEIDNLISFSLANPCDYAYNATPVGNRYPDGLGAELVPFPVLEYLENTVIEPSHREHCFLYITENNHEFTVKTFNPPNSRIANPKVKLDVDDFGDYQRLWLKDFSIDTPDEVLVDLFSKDV